MSSFVLKIIACICMLCDHLGDTLFEGTTFLNYIGRFAFTIFAFQIVQGYIHTHDIKKYIERLFVFAIISQIPFMIFYYSAFNKFAVNVIFTLLFGLLAILIYDKYNKFVGICSCFSLGLIAEICKFDYGFYGVFIIFAFYLFKDKKIYSLLVFIIAVILKFYFDTIKYKLPIFYIFSGNKHSMLMYSTILSILPILLYNGKKGKNTKYFLYIFYPLHLLILGLISLI